jgi:hypothetical protein
MIWNEPRKGTGSSRGRHGAVPWLRIWLFFCLSSCGWGGGKGWRLEKVSEREKQFFWRCLYCKMSRSTYLGGGGLTIFLPKKTKFGSPKK